MIAQTFLEYGITTTIYIKHEEDALRAKQIISNCQNILVEAGMLSKEKSVEIQKSIQFTTNTDCFQSADWILEAVPESQQIKAELFKIISQKAKKTTIISSNTSALSIDTLSKSIEEPSRFCGTHFLNPPHIIPLVEIVRGESTSVETIQILYDFLLKLKKEPVILNKDIKGFLSNRLQFALLREASYLVESGVASPEDIDKALKFGNGLRYMCSGPFKIVDFGGVNVFESVAKYLYPDLNCEQEENKLLENLVKKGYNGVSNYQGFYSYSDVSAREEERKRDFQILEALKIQTS